MKLKQLFLGFISLSVILVSCTKEDIYTPKKESVAETMSVTTMSTSTPVETPKAYIFIEPQSKLSLVVNYLKSVPHSTQTVSSTPFYGFFTGLPIKPTNYTDLVNYINMPHWYNGNLPAVIQSNITQTSAGVYNFGTVKISGPSVNNQFVWITVLIPVNATPNPNWRQSRISTAHANRIYRTPFNTNSTLSNYVLNYNGTRIPVGQYRVYSTYSSTELRPKVIGDFYLKGSNTLP